MPITPEPCEDGCPCVSCTEGDATIAGKLSVEGGPLMGPYVPLADPAGVTIETAPNAVKGSGTITVVTVPADTTVLAVKLAGDDFPRFKINANPTDFGFISLSDGTVDPDSGDPDHTAELYFDAATTPPSIQLLQAQLQVFNGVKFSGFAVHANGDVGFHNATPVPKAAAPVTLADVITILRNLGLCN